MSARGSRGERIVGRRLAEHHQDTPCVARRAAHRIGELAHGATLDIDTHRWGARDQGVRISQHAKTESCILIHVNYFLCFRDCRDGSIRGDRRVTLDARMTRPPMHGDRSNRILRHRTQVPRSPHLEARYAPAVADLLDFSSQTVVITGAASGMGYETTRLLLDAGAQVHALDVVDVHLPVTSSHRCDLGDPAAIDATAAALPTSIDVLVNCAGIPNGTHWSGLDIMKVNFLGLRHLTEALIDRVVPGGAVTNVASIAGNGWPGHVAELTELMATDFAAGEDWCRAHEDVVGDGYFFSKEAVRYYTLWRSVRSVKAGVRMNSISPGVTDTKIMVDFRASMGDAAIDMTAQEGIGRLAQPDEMAPAILFLSHRGAASYINGSNLIIDGGFSAAMDTGQVDFGKYFG